VNEARTLYSMIIMMGFGWAVSFAVYNFTCWLLSLCYPSGMTKGRLTQTVYNLRDVSAAMLMLMPKDVMNRLKTLGEHDLDTLREATTTMVHVFFGKQVSLHRRRQQRMIMGGGFSAWDHNATILQLLEDTESGVLETRVVHSCRFRISLLKLSRAAFALGDLTSSGLSGSWGSKAVSQVLPLGVKSYLDAKMAAKAIQLDKGELTREAFLDMVGKKFGYLHLPTEHVDEMFSCMDVDNSGTVSVTEFISYIMANTPHDLVHQLNEGNLLGYE